MTVITYKIKNIALLIATIWIFCAFLINSELVAKKGIEAMSLCFFRIIPSIFPFMVLSSFLLKTGLLNHIFSRNKFLNIVIVSWLSGFLVGPKYLSELNSQNDFTDASVLLSNAGVGFVISYIGFTLWSNPIFGVYLYVIQIVSSVLIYMLSNKERIAFRYEEKEKKAFFTEFCSSVQDSTQAMLGICGFTVFFSILKEILSNALNWNNGIFHAIFSAFFEISSGAYSSISCKNPCVGAFLIGFTVGFGGLCMCMQTFSCAPYINKRKFLLKKLIQGLMCGLLSYIFAYFSNIESVESVVFITKNNFEVINVVVSSIFLFSSINFFKKALKNIDFL